MKRKYLEPRTKIINYVTDEVMGLPAVVSDPKFTGARQNSIGEPEEESFIQPSRKMNFSVWDEETE